MVSTFISLLDIQSWWEIPCIAHFCSLFSSAFNLPDIDIEDLESALLTDGTDENVGLLPDLIVHLLKGCDKLRKLKKRITTSNYQMFLRRFLRHQCRLHKIENYFDTDIDFQSLPLRNKLLILHSLCHFRLDSEDVQYILSNLEADSLRVEPLGYDSKNSGYWYFYGTRLYREDTKPGGKNTIWQVICFTEEDWQNLATKFKNSSSPKERALHDILVENFLPKLPQLFREREKLRRKKLLQVRNSARIRNHLEEKLKRETAELAERQQIDEQLKIDTAATAANKYKSGRIRRRSQSSSTASGISTYASSIRAALSDSTEFLVQREKFCLSPEDDIYFSSSSKSITPPTTTSSSRHHHKQQNSNRKTQKYKRKVEDNNSDKFLKQKISKIQKEFENESHYESDISSLNDSAADISNDDNDDNNLNDGSSVIIKQEENKENYYIKRKLLLLSSSYQESEEDNLSVKSSKSSSGFVESKLEIMAPTTNIKLPGRKTNNSLSSLTGNIFIPPQIFGNSSTSGGGTQEDHFEMTSDNNHKGNNKEKPSTSSTSSSLPSSLSASVTNNIDNTTTQQKKKKTKASSEIFTETDEVLQIGMHKVLVYVKNHRDAWPFMDPVEEDIAPRYYSIIRRPMDLLKMEDKLDNGEYTKFSEFRNDFKLIVNNCRLYNGQNNEYTEMVNNLQEAFEKATRKYFDQYSSDEEGNLGYPDSKTNVFREKHFNKNNSTKVNQKESSSITTTNIANIATAADKKCSNKEKQDKTHILSDNVSTNKKYEKQQNNDQGPNENLKGTKRKRKDKDKRRKKKIKLKSNSSKTSSTQQMDSTENEDDNDDGNDDDNDDGNDDDKDNDNDIGSNHIKNSGKQQKFEEMNSDADERENDDTNLKNKNKNNLNKSKMKKQKNRNGRNISPTPAINVIPPNKKLKQQKSKGATTVGRTQKNLQSKTKSNSKKTPPNEKIIENKQQSNNNKSGRTGKSVKKESKLIHHAEDTEDMLNEENVVKEDIKNNADYTKKGGKRLNEKQSSTNTSTNNKNKTKQEKENQSIKSKSVNVIKDEKKDSLNKVKDNKIRSGTNNKKKKGKSNKKNETTTQTQNTQQQKKTTSAISNHIKEEQQHTVVDYDSDNDKNDNEKNYVDNYSFSRSPSPLYKVDLHKKYAKSASLQFDDEFIFSSSKITSSNEDNKNKKSTTTKTTLTSKLNRDNEELMSISSRSLSRSLSPSVVMNTTESSTKNNGKKDRTKKSSKDNNNKKNDKRKNSKRNSSIVASRSQSSSLESSSVDKIQQKQQQQQQASSAESDKKEEIIPLFLDKYDLIKQRRSRNTTATTTEEKWNQIVKEAEKIKDTKKNAKSNILSTSKEKNQKLKETIEKLKEKNAKSKERSVLIDEIFGVKPTQEIHDERKIFEKSRETKPETTAGGSGNKSTSNSSSETGQHKEHNETEFVEDVPVSPNKSSPKKKERNHHHEKSKNNISGKKSSSNKGCSSSGSGSKNKENSDRKTNMEALELETEQTLKDINRWLEHTPRLSEFSSASNSPSRYNLLDDFDAVASKLDPNDFRRPVPITPAKIDPNGPKLTDSFEEFSTTNNNSCVENKKDVISSLISAANVVNAEDSASNTATSLSIVIPSTSSSSPLTPPIISTAISTRSSSPSTKLKDTNTTQLLPHPPPPPPHIKTQQQKDVKRKSLKEKLQAVTSKRKDPLRTIDRLQPGKSKGNLISNMHGNKSDEIFPLGASAKIKEVKNALVVKTDEKAPKLSLGSVLNTEGFGFGQLHNFGTDSGSSVSMKISDVISNCSGEKSERKEDGTSSDEMMEKAEEVETTTKEVSPTEKKFESKSEKTLATPNLSAWFKAFGAPKKAKKLEEEEKKSDIVEETQNNINNAEQPMETSSIAATTTAISTTFSTLKSPSSTMENFSLPAPRTRKASTGSTVSERSSFSQDPDSPRVGIDDRFGGYSGPYASPIGASPIMVSPKPDEIGKPTSPYPLNGAIKVGFYQDTTTKSSPEKSCSPRELPSPYPQYSQHVYTSASSPSVGTEIGTAYGTSCYSVSGGGNDDINKNASPAPVYPTNSTVTLYEQYKQPNSHESDYNSTMSPSTNPNSPYQQSQNSPYQQNPNSPYQQSQNSPYHQPQNSPYQSQASSNNSSIIQTKSPTSHQQQSPQGSHSPYQQSINSPYQQSNNSPYNQQSASSPYHTQSQSQSQTQTQSQVQQQQVNMNFNQQQVDSPQQQPSESPYSQESPQYQIHESSQFQQQTDQTQQQNQSTFESKMTKDSDTNSSLVTKIHNPSEWVNPQMDISNSNSQNNSAPTLTELSPMVSSHAPNQLNSTQQLHNEQQQQQIRLHQPQDNKINLPFQNYPQYPIANKGNSMIQHQQDISQSSGLKRPSQTNESEVLSLSNFAESQPPNKTSKCDSDKPFDSTLNKHQQMFDSFLGSMAGNKNLGFGRPPVDISTSKAFEMFNRAATYGLSKEFPNNLLTSNKMDTNSIQLQQISQQQQQHQQQQHQTKNANNITGSGKSIIHQSNFNQEHLVHHQQQQQQHQSLENSTKLQAFQNTLSETSDTTKLNPQQTGLFTQKLNGNQGNMYSNPNLVQSPSMGEKLSNELVVSNSSRQDQQMADMNRNQTLNMDYKQTYNNLRNLNHPLSMIDDNMLNLQNVSSTGCYDKNIPPSAHVFVKGLIPQQSYHQNSPYETRDQQNLTVGNYIPSSVSVGNNDSNLIQQTQMPDGIDPKTFKRVKKKKSSTPTPVVEPSVVNNQNRNSMIPMTGQANHSQTSTAQSIQPLSNVSAQNIHEQQQGFQLYAGLKTASVSATTDSSAISLKTAATSMVPGSAFNFGPSPTGLGLSSGIYGDNSGYLDEFRGPHNPYYTIPPGHRPSPEVSTDKSSNAPPPPSPGPSPSTYQFLTHSSSRTSYPFMNSPQLDPNSPIYQQYLQRQDELRARMMLNQTLLAPSPAPGYPQASYRPPIGMPKHYDMNRQPWF